MSVEPHPAPEPAPGAPAPLPAWLGERRRTAIVIGASLLLSLAIGLWFPLVDPDEGRNAEVAAEMATGGDVVIPHLAGVPYLDKPPGLFALSALAIRALGRRPIAARLPAIVASWLVLLALAHAARRLAREAHAWRTLALFACAPLAAVIAAYTIFDMPLTLCVTVVWLGLALELERGVSPPRRLAMFAAVGLGILLKGPVMLAWALGGSLAGALLLRSAAPLRWLAWAPGWLVGLGLPGAWFAAALQRHPEYLRYAFLEESFERLATRSFDRHQPWWFVPAVFVGGALPWSLATPWRRPEGPAARLGAGFVLFAAVFFALSQSKLVTYLLPAFPPLAWWAAECWLRSRWPAWALAAVLAFSPLVVVGGALPLRELAHRTSGERLARAIERAGPGTVRYEDCYSPGTDFLLGRPSKVVSALGHPLTSNYAVRYRETLERRGQWPLLESAAGAPPAEFIVREARREGRAPAGYREIFRDRRFVAWHRAPR
jgi:4-amino-4-deoxy-L-arabinose transferase-like glycosyltransferase